jgi:hypothetical protein
MGGDPNRVEGSPFVCSVQEPGVSPMRRLSRTPYLNSLRDLLGRAWDPSTVDGFLKSSATAPLIDALPPDGIGGKGLLYDQQDQRISGQLVEAQLNLALAIADWITIDPVRLGTFVRRFGAAGSCAIVTAPGCVTSFIDGFGLRALRRPLDNSNDNDGAFYRSIYDNPDRGGYRSLIAAFLMSPAFLFIGELKGTAVDNRTDLTQLTSFEIASRLSFLLTDSMPDEALLEAAGKGELLDPAQLSLHTERLLAQSTTRKQLLNFYRQWLRPERVPDFNPAITPALGLTYPDNASSSLPANFDLVGLKSHATEELLELADYYTFGAPQGRLSDLFTSDLSFAKTADLAQIYGVSTWPGKQPDGSWDSSRLVHFAANQPRAGIFTRAAFLFSGFPDSNPLIRGARIRVEFLCDVISPPIDTTPPKGTPSPTILSVRNLAAAKTEVPGSACAGCHPTLINPLGFALEDYDSMGRYRTQEALFSNAAVSSWTPVDAATRPAIKPGDLTNVKGGIELSGLLGRSTKAEACFTRNYFRYFFGRQEVDAQDGCLLESLRVALSDPSSGSLKNLLKATPTTPEFALRKINN